MKKDTFNYSNIYRKVVILLFTILFSGNLFAQKISITGIVTDTTKEPIIGSSIFENGSHNGTFTDYQLKFPLSF